MARRQVNSRLAAVADRFEEWRKGRTRGQRIPERLWGAAVELVPECGLCRTSQVLRLDYYTLKRRCEETELAEVPRLIRGTAMNLIIAGILSMAFMGFAGLLSTA